MRPSPPSTFVPLPEDQLQWRDWAAALPFVKVLGLTPDVMTPSHVTCRLEHSAGPLNPNGAVNGGLILAAADQVMSLAAMTVVAPGRMVATATLDTHFLRPALLPLVFEARVTRTGQMLTFVQMEMRGADGRPCLSAMGSWSVVTYSSTSNARVRVQ